MRSEARPVTLAVMNNRLAAIAEEMGVVLGQTGFSPNIKERHDFSCALFDGGGELVAQAAHMPVHLGSTPLSVRAAIERLELGPGDVAAVNDPFAGGTHLPDLTLVAPIFLGRRSDARSRSPPTARITPISAGWRPARWRCRPRFTRRASACRRCKIVRAGKPARDVLELFFANTRVREEREGDLRAQIAALRRRRGAAARTGRIVRASAGRRGDGRRSRTTRPADASDACAGCRPGTYRADDFLDDDGFGTGPIPIRVAIRIGGGRARRRFHRVGAAGARFGQRELRDHAVGDLLRDEVPGRGSGAGQRRPDAADSR